MNGIDELISKVEAYQANCLNLKKLKFKVSDPYDLVEDWKVKDSYYPFRNRQGIYAIFDAEWGLLYIGKASNESTIGKRLGTYFKDDEDGKFRLVDSEKSWGDKRPRYIIAVSVSEAYEAPSLEEFLISNLQPKSNSVGRN